jgi:hypothetical protein
MRAAGVMTTNLVPIDPDRCMWTAAITSWIGTESARESLLQL